MKNKEAKSVYNINVRSLFNVSYECLWGSDCEYLFKQSSLYYYCAENTP